MLLRFWIPPYNHPPASGHAPPRPTPLALGPGWRERKRKPGLGYHFGFGLVWGAQQGSSLGARSLLPASGAPAHSRCAPRPPPQAPRCVHCHLAKSFGKNSRLEVESSLFPDGDGSLGSPGDLLRITGTASEDRQSGTLPLPPTKGECSWCMLRKPSLRRWGTWV